MGERKVFEPGLHDQFDAPSKAAWAEWLKRIGWPTVVIDPDGIYGVDVSASNGQRTLYYEVEVRRRWRGWVFADDTIHFLERKLKYIHKHKENFRFVVMNPDLDRAYVLTGEQILNSPVRTIPNYMCEGECFHDVPIPYHMLPIDLNMELPHD